MQKPYIATLYAEIFFRDGLNSGTKYRLEGEVTEVGSLSNYELDELARELRERESVSTRKTIYQNFHSSEITTSQRAPIEGSGLSLVVLKTGLNFKELKSLAQMISRVKGVTYIPEIKTQEGDK